MRLHTYPEIIAQAPELVNEINKLIAKFPAELVWDTLVKRFFSEQDSFALHLAVFKYLFPDWLNQPGSAPAWLPNPQDHAKTNLGRFINELHLKNSHEFHQWSVLHDEIFWTLMISKLQIQFKQPPQQLVDLSLGLEKPRWLVGAKMNIIDSCFTAPPEKTAILYQAANTSEIQAYSYAELNQLSNRIAASLKNNELAAGDAIAIAMPMTFQAVAIYLGIIKMGGIVVSIADSFAPEEIAIRLQISQTKAIFTQAEIIRGTKAYPLYQKIMQANAPRAIVLTDQPATLRSQDIAWDSFLGKEEQTITYASDPMDHINILFSSGTTGTPKAIPWNHTTAIKAASDAYLHQDIQSTDILTWPTNLGWMMGPWLIFAALINQATIAIYDGNPNERGFGEFVEHAKVTMLGVVPTLVANWRKNECMRDLDWSRIKTFSSTGEASHPEDMLYLMSLAGYRPIIEYCGGTEIGGAYLSSTLLDKNYPAIFTTPAMGIDFVILDEQGHPSDEGEVAIIPPSIGLSTELLNGSHHQVYYDGMPTPLRRHGDQLKRYPDGLYSILGRHDDTMNLGGIKISSIEIERALAGCEHILETAAIANAQNALIIYAVATQPLSKQAIQQQFQTRINQRLNPLFKIHDVIFIDELPKTASNKILRRQLRNKNS